MAEKNKPVEDGSSEEATTNLGGLEPSEEGLPGPGIAERVKGAIRDMMTATAAGEAEALRQKAAAEAIRETRRARKALKAENKLQRRSK